MKVGSTNKFSYMTMEISRTFERDLEQKIYELFREELPKDFDINKDQRLDSSRRADITITKEDKRIAVIEVKVGLQSGSIRNLIENQLTNLASLAGFRYAIIAQDEDKFLLKDCYSNENNTFDALSIHDICKKIVEAGTIRNGELEIYRDAVFDKLKKLFNEIEKQFEDRNKKMRSFINKYKGASMEMDEDSFYFTDKKVEDKLFECFLEKFVGDRVCRYTSLPSVFRTLDEEKQSMCCIVGMNDRSECTYADSYLQRLGAPTMLSSKTPYEARIENSFYILSCMDEEKYDDLTMWRLYGDNTRGVNILYNVGKVMPGGFKMYCINYAEQQGERGHNALNIISELMCLTVANRKFRLKKWNEWKHFFKPYEYRDEKEIKLLYTKDKPINNKKGKPVNKWILTGDYQIVCPLVLFDLPKFPLKIEEIKLGPNCPDVDVNQLQIELMIKGKGTLGITRKQDVVNTSRIETYRLSNN